MSHGMNRQTYEQISNIVDRKDNTWLQLDVCPIWRDTRRCPEGDRCCHAHPPENIDILESNRVVSCYDDVKKGTCRRSDCKFFHPPNHLKNVVNTNGRNNLRLRNELKQQLKSQVGGVGVALGPTPFLAPSASYLPASPLYPVTSWHEQLQMQMQMVQSPPIISAPPTTRESAAQLVPVPLVGSSVPMESCHTPRHDSPPPPPGTNLGAKKRSRTPDVDTTVSTSQKFRDLHLDTISPKAKRLTPPRITDLDIIPDIPLNFPLTPLQFCQQTQAKRQTSNQEIPLDLTTYPTFLPPQSYNYDNTMNTYQTMLLNPPPGYVLPTTYQMFPPSFNYTYPQYPAYQYQAYPTSMPITQARIPGEGLTIPTITTNRSTPH